MVLRTINGIITILFFPYLLKVYLETERRFYLNWAVGFFLLGLRIVLRSLSQFYCEGIGFICPLSFFILQLVGLSALVAGIGELVDQYKSTLYLLGVMDALLIGLFMFLDLEMIILISSLGLYSYISFILPYIRREYSLSLNHFIAGWGMLFLINIVKPLGMFNPILLELMTISGKILIFYAMTQTGFRYLAEDISQYIAPKEGRKEVVTGDSRITLLESTARKQRELEYLSGEIKRNSERGVRSVVISTYDLIMPEELLRYGLERDDFYIIRMLIGEKGSSFNFEEHQSIIRDDLNELDFVVRDIIEYTHENKMNLEIYFYNISSLIHIHGARRVYSFMVSKIPTIKESNLSLHIFLHPKTHEDESTAALFRSIVDQVEDIA
ncbi:MAG: hypothetical protein ACLFVP_09535 [Candidatus Bathyarchaeia archaeon]